MKEKFYVFTDIDGTLNDINFINTVGLSRIKAKHGENYHEKISYPLDYEFIDPKCVQALDYLLAKLEENYDTQLVISSDLRRNMPLLLEKLKENGLRYPKPIRTTPHINNSLRGIEILSFLKDKPNNNNIVIIDDGKYDLYKRFKEDKIIPIECGRKLDNKEYSLSKNHVEVFLNNLHKNPHSPSAPKDKSKEK